MYVWRQKKFPFTVRTTGWAISFHFLPFPFNFRVVAVLLHFQTVPVLFQGQPSVLVNGPDIKIKRAWSLIALEFSVF